MKENLINKIKESFDNVFDSSLIDYSSDFEKQDEHYKRIKQIKDWLDTYCVNINVFKDSNQPDYIINDDYTIDVFSSFYIMLCNSYIKDPLVNGALPDYIKFNKCDGSFIAAGGLYYQLKSLIGFPKYVGGTLDLKNNTFLKDLKGCPDIIGGDLNLTGCTGLINVIKTHGGYPLGWVEYENYKILHEEYGFPLFGLNEYLYGGDSNIYIPDNKDSNIRISKSLLIHNYKKWMEKENKIKVDESFNIVFDSSLIDYSKDFEEQDKQYKINQIKEWIQNNIMISGNKGIGAKVYDPYLHRANWAANDMFWRFFEINDDYSIDIVNPYPGSYGLSFTAEIFPLEWSPSYIALNGKNSPEYVFSKKIGMLKELPEYIKFNKCEGSFKISDVKIESLRGFPEYIYKNITINDTNIRTLEGGPKLVKGGYILEDNHGLCNFKGAPLECNSFVWKDYKKDYCPATDAVYPKYEDNKLINKEQL